MDNRIAWKKEEGWLGEVCFLDRNGKRLVMQATSFGYAVIAEDGETFGYGKAHGIEHAKQRCLEALELVK